MLTDERIDRAIETETSYVPESELRRLCRATEAEAMAEAQEPVAWKWRRHRLTKWEMVANWDEVEEMAALEMDQRGWEVVRLYTTQQPPAPCPICADKDWYGIDALQAKVAEQRAEIERLKVCVEDEREVRQRVERGAVSGREQQAERIAELERQVDDLEAELDDAEVPIWPEWAEQCLKIVRKHREYDGFDDADGIDLPEELRELLAEYDTEFDRERAKLVAANGRITEQAALIEKCEKALKKHGAAYLGHQEEYDEALAAIAAQKGGAV